MKKQSNPMPEGVKRPPAPPAPPPNRMYKETFFSGLVETEESKQNTRDWQNSNKLETIMKLKPTSDWHEDLGVSIFVCFSRDENNVILGEPPELYYGSGYLEDNFDSSKWTHFIDGDFNFIFSDADPLNFPPSTIGNKNNG